MSLESNWFGMHKSSMSELASRAAHAIKREQWRKHFWVGMDNVLVLCAFTDMHRSWIAECVRTVSRKLQRKNKFSYQNDKFLSSVCSAHLVRWTKVPQKQLQSRQHKLEFAVWHLNDLWPLAIQNCQWLFWTRLMSKEDHDMVRKQDSKKVRVAPVFGAF